jgi:hypothetical protein
VVCFASRQEKQMNWWPRDVIYFGMATLLLFSVMMAVAHELRQGDAAACERQGFKAVDIPGRTLRMVCEDQDGALHRRPVN